MARTRWLTVADILTDLDISRRTWQEWRTRDLVRSARSYQTDNSASAKPLTTAGSNPSRRLLHDPSASGYL